MITSYFDGKKIRWDFAGEYNRTEDGKTVFWFLDGIDDEGNSYQGTGVMVNGRVVSVKDVIQVGLGV